MTAAAAPPYRPCGRWPVGRAMCGDRESRVLGFPRWLARRSKIWDVPHHDPRAAVVAELTAPPDCLSEPETVSEERDRAPRAMLTANGPFARDPAAIAVIKERERGERRLYAVSFDNLQGNRWFWLVAAERSQAGWVARGVAGGTDGPARRTRETPRPASAGSGPWLNLCGQWGGDTFYAGGSLDPAGGGIGRVVLTLGDGSQLEDDGVAGVSLFIGHHGEPPRTVDIYATDGGLLSSQDAY